MAPSEQTKLLLGTLDLLILQALALEPKHGLGISRRIEQITRGTFVVKPGSLFPALHRMEEAGWLDASWGVVSVNTPAAAETTRRAKFYKLTPDGKRQLEREKRQWHRISDAIANALEAS